MKYTSLVTIAALILLGAGCRNDAPPTTPNTPPSTTQAPGTQTPPPPAPTPAPTRTPETNISVTGDFNYTGKILVACSPANPVSDPSSAAKAGWQFRGGSMGRENGNGAYIILNYHNGTDKRAGVQSIGFGQGKGVASVEWSPQEGVRSTSYFGAENGLNVTLSNDFQTATVVGQMEEALNPARKIQVNATVKCQ